MARRPTAPPKVFVYGGGDRASSYLCEGSTATTERYDVVTKTWAHAGDTASMLESRAGCVAVSDTYNGKVFLFGGQPSVKNIDVSPFEITNISTIGI
jgi:hypothetical protein